MRRMSAHGPDRDGAVIAQRVLALQPNKAGGSAHGD